MTAVVALISQNLAIGILTGIIAGVGGAVTAVVALISQNLAIGILTGIIAGVVVCVVRKYAITGGRSGVVFFRVGERR